MQIQEDQDEVDQNKLRQLLQFTHLGAKMTKNQIQNIQLLPLVKQISQQSLRECANYLQGFTLCLIKQYSHLRADVHQLQLSLTEETHKVRQQTKQSPQKRTKRIQQQGNPKIPLLQFQENTTSSIDNPRNVASKDKISLEQDPGEMVNMPFVDSDSQSGDIFNNMHILEEVKSLENKSIKEIMRQEKENSTPNVPRIIITEPEDLMMDMQMSPPRQQKLMMQFDSVGKKFEEHSENQQKQQDEEKNRSAKKNKRVNNNVIIDEQLIEDKLFQANLSEFTRYQDKLDDMNLKMNLFNIHQEFWNERENLMSLVEQNMTALEETDLIRKSLNEQADPFVTTILDNKAFQDSNQGFQISEFDDFQQQEELSEYIQEHKQSVMKSEKKKQQIVDEEEQVYSKIAKSIFKKGNRVTQNTYFDIRDEEGISKAKAFYDLLVMARIGKLKIKDDKVNGRYSNMIIELN